MFGSPSRTPTSEQRHNRWEADRAVLRARLPKVRHLVLLGTGRALASGVVDIDAGAGRFEPVQVEMQFAEHYPDECPRVWERSRRWTPSSDRHIHPDGELCLGLPGVDQPVTATVDDFAHFLGQLLVFLHDQFIFDATEAWPGPTWAHGYQAAFTQFVCETLGIDTEREARRLYPLIQGRTPRAHEPCPCGSRLPYARCHKEQVHRVRSIGRLQPIPDLRDRMINRTHVAST